MGPTFRFKNDDVTEQGLFKNFKGKIMPKRDELQQKPLGGHQTQSTAELLVSHHLFRRADYGGWGLSIDENYLAVSPDTCP